MLSFACPVGLPQFWCVGVRLGGEWIAHLDGRMDN